MDKIKQIEAFVNATEKGSPCQSCAWAGSDSGYAGAAV